MILNFVRISYPHMSNYNEIIFIYKGYYVLNIYH